MALKPLQEKTRLLRVLLVMFAAVTFLSTEADLYEYYSYKELPVDTNYDEVILLADFVTIAVAILYLIIYAILAVTFLTWISRINKNLHILSNIPMEYTSGWAIGWYFVPFANLLMPYRVMKEIWIVSHKDTEPRTELIKWWWFLWITSNFLGNIVMRMTLNMESVGDNTRLTLISAGLDIPDFISTIVAFMLVTSISKAYSENYDESQPTYDGICPDVPELPVR